MAIDYTSPIGQIRLSIGDLDESNLKLSDEQIDGMLSMAGGSILFATLYACYALVGIYSATAGDEYKVDTLEYKEGKSKVSNLQNLISDIRKVTGPVDPRLCGVPFTTGIYIDELNENMQRINDGEIIGPQIKDGEYDIVDFDDQDGPYQK